MKLLLLNYEFPPLGGGAGNATFFLLKQLAKYSGLKIDLITASTDKDKKEAFSKNINIYYLNIGKNKQNLHNQSLKDLLVYSFKAYFKAKQLQQNQAYGLVHAFFGIPCGFISWALAKSYIVSLRGSDVPFYNPRFYWLDKLVFKYLNQVIWRQAKFVVANSQNLKKLALQTSPHQAIKIIPNGVDTSIFKPSFKTTKKKIILFVGRLIKRKGLKYLLKAYSQTNQSFQKQYQIWLVGDGPAKSLLLKLAQQLNINRSVKFLGVKTKNELVKIYNQSMIFVLPSLNEGMSNALLEAMACGLPVIVTNVGGTQELIKDNGFVVRRRSIQEIKKALEAYARNQQLLNSHSRQSIKITQKLTWQKTTNKYFSLYKKCL